MPQASDSPPSHADPVGGTYAQTQASSVSPYMGPANVGTIAGDPGAARAGGGAPSRGPALSQEQQAMAAAILRSLPPAQQQQLAASLRQLQQLHVREQARRQQKQLQNVDRQNFERQNTERRNGYLPDGPISRGPAGSGNATEFTLSQQPAYPPFPLPPQSLYVSRSDHENPLPMQSENPLRRTPDNPLQTSPHLYRYPSDELEHEQGHESARVNSDFHKYSPERPHYPSLSPQHQHSQHQHSQHQRPQKQQHQQYLQQPAAAYPSSALLFHEALGGGKMGLNTQMGRDQNGEQSREPPRIADGGGSAVDNVPANYIAAREHLLRLIGAQNIGAQNIATQDIGTQNIGGTEVGNGVAAPVGLGLQASEMQAHFQPQLGPGMSGSVSSLEGSERERGSALPSGLASRPLNPEAPHFSPSACSPTFNALAMDSASSRTYTQQVPRNQSRPTPDRLDRPNRSDGPKSNQTSENFSAASALSRSGPLADPFAASAFQSSSATGSAFARAEPQSRSQISSTLFSDLLTRLLTAKQTDESDGTPHQQPLPHPEPLPQAQTLSQAQQLRGFDSTGGLFVVHNTTASPTTSDPKLYTAVATLGAEGTGGAHGTVTEGASPPMGTPPPLRAEARPLSHPSPSHWQMPTLSQAQAAALTSQPKSLGGGVPGTAADVPPAGALRQLPGLDQVRRQLAASKALTPEQVEQVLRHLVRGGPGARQSQTQAQSQTQTQQTQSQSQTQTQSQTQSQSQNPQVHQNPLNGHPQFGHPQFGQPQFGQPQFGQPQIGQPQIGADVNRQDGPNEFQNLRAPSSGGTSANAQAAALTLAMLLQKNPGDQAIRKQVQQLLLDRAQRIRQQHNEADRVQQVGPFPNLEGQPPSRPPQGSTTDPSDVKAESVVIETAGPGTQTRPVREEVGAGTGGSIDGEVVSAARPESESRATLSVAGASKGRADEASDERSAQGTEEALNAAALSEKDSAGTNAVTSIEKKCLQSKVEDASAETKATPEAQVQAQSAASVVRGDRSR